MTTLFDVPVALLLAQITLGLVNGCFYAILSLGLAVIFGMLNIVNFAHGTLYMMGAYVAYIILTRYGLSYWWALAISPLVIGVVGIVLERILIRHTYKMDHMYGLLLTFGIALVIDSIFRTTYGVSGQPYAVPENLTGAIDLNFMRLPIYRAWVVLVSAIVCVAVWYAIEKTKLGSYLRAATENAQLTAALGINVSVLIVLTFGFGAALAGLAGVLAAPIVQVSPLMGGNIIIIVFAVVVIGGMGSILGSIFTGVILGLVEGMVKVFYPQGSAAAIFVVMIVILLVRPAGLFGRRL